MSQNGGKRDGAGRPKGISTTTKIGLELRKKLVEGVKKRWKELEQASFDLALGHFEEKLMPDGKTVLVYKIAPDGNMIKYLKDQTLGKAKDTIEIENPQGNEELREINKKLNDMFYDSKDSGKRT